MIIGELSPTKIDTAIADGSAVPLCVRFNNYPNCEVTIPEFQREGEPECGCSTVAEYVTTRCMFFGLVKVLQMVRMCCLTECSKVCQEVRSVCTALRRRARLPRGRKEEGGER